MCYDIKTSLKNQLKRAIQNCDIEQIKEIEEKLKPLLEEENYHISGFSHAKSVIYTTQKPFYPTLAIWGLIPAWSKDKESATKFWNNTLNARGETIFDKPSFRTSAKSKRCVCYVDGFFEHHHYNGSTYPFYIFKKDNEPMPLAGLWEEWVDKSTGEILKTFTIVTTKGNDLLAKIHNNPKLKEPRMPVILNNKDVEDWLNPDERQDLKSKIQELIKPFPQDELSAFTVRKLRGKEAVGNIPDAIIEHKYEELKVEPLI